MNDVKSKAAHCTEFSSCQPTRHRAVAIPKFLLNLLESSGPTGPVHRYDCAMRSTLCLRLARQSANLRRYAATRCVVSGGLPSLKIRPANVLLASGRRSRSSGPELSVSRFAPQHKVRELLSPFKQHRREMFQEDQESEDPLYSNLFPRLENCQTREAISEFLEQFETALRSEQEVTLYGRVRSKRVIGKGLVFLDIVNEFQKVQVMINKNACTLDGPESLRKFALFRKMLQIGDHISVVGRAVRTKAGEPTLEASQMPQLIAPTMEEIPEVLIDSKTRMAKRHLDMLVNKEVVDRLRLRSEIVAYMRDHFHSKRFLEFQTPILAEDAGGAIARAFVTRSTELREKALSLRVAPELWLKRLVVGGVDKVFEIGPAFRNEGIDATHNPEFTMCEFYSAYTTLAELIKESEDLLHGLAKRAQEAISTQLTTLPPIDPNAFVGPFKQVEFIPGLEEALGFRLPKLSREEDALPELLALLKLKGIDVPGEVPDSLHKLLDRLASMYLEPLSLTEPLFITHHPACMSPLAKGFLCPDTYQLISARAELFVGGRELANMYEEENNPEEQKRKLKAHRMLVNKPDGETGFEAPKKSVAQVETVTDEDTLPLPTDAIAQKEDVDNQIRVQSSGDGPPLAAKQTQQNDDQDDEWEALWPLDASYVKALDHGLPPTGGWGCGIERLVMLFSGATRISDCLSFGTLRHVVNMSSEERQKGATAGRGGGDETDDTLKETET
ncbi:hypothetical protein E4U58_006548 [Claviceps cyperi]|nr:hypothetical protein E4U58_006548 [Claviceps cyperi]